MYYTVYCDGAFSPVKKTGGIAFIILNDKGETVCDFFKAFTNTTNQRMEQLAAIIALESIKSSSEITIISDSLYVVNTYNNNWKRKSNLDLWDRFDKAIAKHINVRFVHIRGHQGNHYNELCDVLAKLINE
jgi:ribonuclease HI